MATRTTQERLPVEKTYKLYIGGEFPRTESGRYYPLADERGKVIANVCRASRKDFREAVVAARKAQPGWAASSAYLRGQILYRIAEMLEGRAEQFVEELVTEGAARRRARSAVELSIDRLIYFAGWADKYQQIFSAVNPVASSHFNFSVPEATGVVALLAPQRPGLLGLVANLAPAIVGGNTVVALASQGRPLTSISLGEVLHAADLPAGVVNILTGYRHELTEHFASHMDVNAIVFCDEAERYAAPISEAAAANIKRVVNRCETDWRKAAAASPYLIQDTQEIKTTWHPIGN
ncbi:MAG: aldehyde dehydrogenase family protein [Pseudomonadota bacterium]